MIKRIALYCVVVGVLFAALYSTHIALIDLALIRFSLLSIYLFNVIASVLTYIAVELTFYKLPDQTGYAFLAAVFLKLGLFTVLFMSTLTSDEALRMTEKLSILVPFGVYLLVEAGAIFKLLNVANKS